MDLHPTCYRHPGREATISCQRCGRPICTECMIPASVGFQCPECVARGAKETRQQQTPYGGTKVANPAQTSLAIIVANAAIWAGVVVTGWSASFLVRLLALTPGGVCLSSDPSQYYPDANAAICAQIAGAHWAQGVASGAWWQVVTNAFLHIDIWHIGFNMLALWILGPQLERLFGRARFLALYLVSALTASAVVMWLSNPTTSTLGASGAIFGLMGALLVVAIKHKGDVRSILFWVGANVVLTFLGRSFISWEGHMGGLVGGTLVALAVLYTPKGNRSTMQWVMIGGLGVLALIAIVLRAMQLA